MGGDPIDITEMDRLAAPSYRDPTAFAFAGGPVGVLLIHGFGGMPGEMRGLGESLAAHGFTVRAPLLAGHGGSPEDLAATAWPGWLDAAARELRALRRECETVVLAGFSMGGAIALILAAREPVDGIVTMAAPVYIDTPLVHLLPVARYVMPYLYPLRWMNLSNPAVMDRLRLYMPDLEIDPTDAAQVARLRRSVKISLQAIYQVTRLIRVARAALPRVTVPALLMQGQDDEQVSPVNLDVIRREIGSREQEVVRFERAGHVLPVGPAKDDVCARVVAFVQRIEARRDSIHGACPHPPTPSP